MASLESEAPREDSNDYAAREFLDISDDPREVAALAFARDAKLPDRLFLPGNSVHSVDMQSRVEYSLR